MSEDLPRDRNVDLADLPAGFATPTPSPLPRLPSLGGGDHLTAIATAADRLFVHWHVDARSLVRLKGALGTGGAPKMNLRVYLLDVSEHGEGAGRATRLLDRPVEGLSGHRHLELSLPGGARSGRWVVVSIGLDDGHAFGHLVRSAPVALPAPAVSGDWRFHAGALTFDQMPLIDTADPRDPPLPPEEP